MSTCKDCIHYDLCADFNLTVGADYTRNMQIVVDDGNPERCGFFKDRSKYVNIPGTISIEDLADAYEGIGNTMLNYAKRLRKGKFND